MYVHAAMGQHGIAMTLNLWVQEMVGPAVKNLGQEGIHKMQDPVFGCCAGCCGDSQVSMQQQVQQGVEHCPMPLAQAQDLVTSNLEKSQDCLCIVH